MPPRSQFVVIVRAVLACAMLWIAAPRVAQAAPERAEVVCVAGSRPARGGSARASVQRRTTTRDTRARSGSVPRDVATREPSLGTDTWVLVEDRYLRHLSILC